MPLVLLPLVAVPLSFLVLWLALYGMHKGSNDWLSPLLAGIVPRSRGLWGFVLSIGALIVKPLTDAALRVFHSVSHAISLAASHQMGTATHWTNANTAREHLLSNAHAGFMAEVATGLGQGFEVKVPRKIREKTNPIAKKAGGALILAGLTAAALRRYRHGIDRLLHHKVIPGLHHATHAVDVALPGSIAGVRSRVGSLERDFAHPSRAWVRRIGHALWGGVLLGLLVKWLARKFPWLFCRQTRQVGRRLCAIDPGLLSSLLADTLLFAGLFSLKDFARAVYAFLDITTPAIKAFVQEVSDLVGGDYLGPVAGSLDLTLSDYLG